MSSVIKSFYVTGGTLRSDAPSYVARQADTDLYQGIKQGDYCYVLTARQMGKSSLMVRAAHQLRKEGVAVAVLDLTSIGQNLSAEQWYLGLLDHVGQQLHLETELEDFWEEHASLGPLQRWMQAMREVVLERHTGKVVILIDEIDAVRSLPFTTDEFFAAIRECFNRRTSDPAMARVTFCLFGVATPSDLIRDTRTTPFNIGRRIELADFREQEAQPLAQGLNRDPATASALLARIFYWTAGHPYLMQRMCRVVAEDVRIKTQRDVDRLCRELFLSPRAKERDDNLLFVRERILRSEVDRASLLDLFDRVRRGKHVPDDETDPLISVLRLSGITRVEQGALRLRNPIYADVFDAKWIESNLPDAEKRRQRRAYRRGLVRASIAAGVLMVILGGLLWYGWNQQVKSLEAQAQVESEKLVQKELKATIGKLEDAIATGERLAKERDDFNAKLIEAMKAADEERRLSLQKRSFQLAADRGWQSQADGLAPQSLGWSQSLAWFLDAMDQDKGDSKRLPLHELRLGGVLARMPRLSAVLPHDDALADADLHPSGEQIVAIYRDNVVEWRDSTTGEKNASWSAEESLARVQFVDRGRHALVIGKSGRVFLLSSAGKLVQSLGQPVAVDKQAVTVVAVGHADDRVLAAVLDPGLSRAGPGVRDVGVVHVLDLLAEGDRGKKGPAYSFAHKQASKDQALPVEVLSAAFSPDLRWLATASADNVVRVWDLSKPAALPQEIKASGTPELVFKAPSALVVSVRVDPGPTATPFVHLMVHHPGARRLVFDKQLPLQLIGVSSDGRWLFTNGSELKSQLWRLPGGEVDFGDPAAKSNSPGGQPATPWVSSSRQLDHDGALAQVTFSPDGRLLAGVHKQSKAVRVWDTATGKAVQPWLHANVARAHFSRNGRFLMTAASDDSVRLWDLYHEAWGMPPAQLSEARAACCSSDGRALAVVGSDHTIWVCANARLPLAWQAIQAGGWTERVWLSADGARLVSASADKKLISWDTATGSQLKEFAGGGGQVRLEFRPRSRAVLIMNGSDEVRLVDCDSGGELRRFAPEHAVEASFFSADGAVLALRGPNVVSVWHVDKGVKLCEATLAGPGGLDLAADGQLLALIGSDGAARVLRTATGATVHTFNQPQDARGVSFSADGATVATWGKDRAVYLWSMATGKRQAPPLVEASAPAKVRFCHNDDLVLIVSRDGAVSLWERLTGQRVLAPLVPPWPAGEELRDAVLCEAEGTLVLVGNRHAGAVRLRPDKATRDCLAKLCRVISGHEVNRDTTRLHALEAKQVASLWSDCRSSLAALPKEGGDDLAWRLQALVEAERAGDLWAAQAHLDKLMTLQPDPLWRVRQARVLRGLGQFAAAKETLLAAAKELPAEVLAWEKTKDLLDEAAHHVKQILGDAPTGAAANQVYRFKLLGKERQVYSFAGKNAIEYKFTVDPDRKEATNTFDVAIMDSSNKDFTYRAGLFGTSTVTWSPPMDGTFKVEVYNFTTQPNEYTLTIAEGGRKQSFEGLSWPIKLVTARERLDECQEALEALPAVFHSHYATLTLPYMQLGRAALQTGRIVQADDDFATALACWQKAGMASVTVELKQFSADCEQLANKFKVNAAEDRARGAFLRALTLEGWTGAVEPADKDLERYWRLYFEMGRAQESVLDMPAARAAMDKAIAGQKQWLKTVPTRRVEALAHLANGHYHLGDIERYKEDFERAYAEYGSPNELIDSWLKDFPAHHTGLEHRAFIQRQLGRSALRMGEVAKAKKHLEAALAIYHDLKTKKAFDTSGREWANALLDVYDADAQPTPSKDAVAQLASLEAEIAQLMAQKRWRDAADLCEDLGHFFEYRQAPAKALGYWLKALENHRKDLDQYKDLTARRSVAYTVLMASDMAARAGDAKLALQFGQEGLERYEALLADAPDSIVFSENRAFACSYLGDACCRLGDPAQARSWYEKGAAYYDDLLDVEKGSLLLRNRQANLRQKLGAAWLQAGNAAEAKAQMEMAWTLHPPAEHAVLVRDRLQTSLLLAEACKRLEDYPAARAACARALRLLEERAAAMQSKLSMEVLQVRAWTHLGSVELFAGDYAAAAEWFAKAHETAARLDGEKRLPTAGIPFEDALGRVRSLVSAEQQKLWLEVAKGMPAALADPATIAKATPALAAELHRWRAVVMARQGKTGAVLSAADAVGKQQHKSGQHHLDAARVHALAVLALAKGKPLAELAAKDKQVIEDLVRRGVDRLGQLAKQANVDWLRLLADAELDALRHAEEYRKLAERKPG